jgi:hypothetical protein
MEHIVGAGFKPALTKLFNDKNVFVPFVREAFVSPVLAAVARVRGLFSE